MPKTVTRVTIERKEISDVLREYAKKYVGMGGNNSSKIEFIGGAGQVLTEVEACVVEFQGAVKE